MANTKTQKPLSISKTKSENIVEWIVNEVHWKLLADNLEKKKSTIFVYKKQIKEMSEERNAFYALGEVFTLNQLNAVIELFNDHLEHPEKYEKPKTKKEINIEKQAEIVKKHMEEMNMDYLKPKKGEKENKEQGKSVDNKEGKLKRQHSTQDIVKKHIQEARNEREEINKLDPNSEERKRKEVEFKSKEVDRIKEYWQSKKNNKEE
ncbi:TPA: hypothetical protein OWX15_002720 [Staphylococcus aureus]|uniref:hypothetical protein n=1 Tax=Staphylococcus aureus TaxID=1280 RepID=UPI0018D7C21A|nr:hypothetical protein [Staphylococcus aureus]MBH4791773.1 hypothetical protein [Staphylococcus aureus]MBH4824889.1 hypothetical protein [Staphylococcus aureus]MBY0808868.1 hypothetical protein [Staphylococcus aureus]MBZ5277308.1 hypothetical protein [Staphylococcus aureus]HBH8925076.1 hypothetical protein [Staphylococcus aureus]